MRPRSLAHYGGGDDAPPVSILLPVFDAGTFLDDCLSSLGRQTHRDFEIVAVDDGSRDASARILADWARADPRLRVLSRQHEGLVAALNVGLAECRAPLVARMDADDIAHPRRLELQMRAFAEQPELDVVSCLVCHFPRPGLAAGFRIYESWLNRLLSHEDIVRERFIESPLPHPSVMVRRRMLVEAGGYNDRGWPEDYDLWLRLAKNGARFGKVPRRLLFWRHHGGRLTCQDQRYRVERFLQCKAYHLVQGPLQKVDRVIVWGAGKTGRRLCKHLQRFGRAPEGFIDIDPRKIGGTLRRIPIWAPPELVRLFESEENTMVLSAVASRGAREIIREHLKKLGLEEGRDFWSVA